MSTPDPNAPIFPLFDFKMKADPDDPTRLRAVLDAEQAAAGLARWAREVEAGRYTAELVRLGWTPPGAARPAPARDEDTVTEAVARALHDEHVRRYPDDPETGQCSAGPGQPVWRHLARAAVAVVREHAPVQPGRETVARAFFDAGAKAAAKEFGLDEPVSWDSLGADDVGRLLAQADAALALWPGESRAAHDREVARRAWQEGFSTSERCWKETYDLTTPDEERADPRNPYREKENES